ncbi:Lipid A 3-O-deacylase (PagL) [Luteibacter sp. UNCMF331Sha3.1]|uniref:acyloxyacyl hydrolase n=1 Tax=Luteibacter sp. UNCMF331Sha3.1 TaxID=1502760 RepID=UPI0008CA81EA|nr:acyloxyacyl hydrolase [Luteibacter sp. UNCMF331Sha3.1]SEM57529.1 Lipid A 3-O-deacylase (PagL) [Luteibacter sp. UNCMF331Sha3.1]
MRSSRLALGALAALSLAAVTVPAAAQTHLEIQGGRSYMNSYGTNAFFAEAVFAPEAMGQSRFTWSPDVSIGYIKGRDIGKYRNADPGTTDDIWVGALGARFHYGSAGDWYQPFFFSFQVAGTAGGRTQALSSGYEFVSTLGWQYKNVSFQVRHISNGSFQEPNRGETMALVGFGFDI